MLFFFVVPVVVVPVAGDCNCKRLYVATGTIRPLASLAFIVPESLEALLLGLKDLCS